MPLNILEQMSSSISDIGKKLAKQNHCEKFIDLSFAKGGSGGGWVGKPTAGANLWSELAEGKRGVWPKARPHT